MALKADIQAENMRTYNFFFLKEPNCRNVIRSRAELAAVLKQCSFV